MFKGDSRIARLQSKSQRRKDEGRKEGGRREAEERGEEGQSAASSSPRPPLPALCPPSLLIYPPHLPLPGPPPPRCRLPPPPLPPRLAPYASATPAAVRYRWTVLAAGFAFISAGSLPGTVLDAATSARAKKALGSGTMRLKA